MRILAIETSCDETAVAVVREQRHKIIVEASLFSSQIPLHRLTQGVVPEVAARAHTETIIPTIQAVLAQAKVNHGDIDAIAVTRGPGLFTSLMVGVETAKFLAKLWHKPLIPIQHHEGHIYSNFVGKFPISNFQFPMLALIVSGGHTMLVLMKKHLQYKILGATLDDAAGEAFDKTATLLGLSYPGGPEISRLARHGNPHAVPLPRPLLNRPDYNFSFSGLKTAVLYGLQKQKIKKTRNQEIKITRADWAASIQQAIVDVLVAKTMRAAKEYRVKTVLLAGGVAANTSLRETLEKKLKQECPRTKFSKPDLAYTTDNAAMIAAAAVFRYYAGDTCPPETLTADPNLKLASIAKSKKTR